MKQTFLFISTNFGYGEDVKSEVREIEGKDFDEILDKVGEVVYKLNSMDFFNTIVLTEENAKKSLPVLMKFLGIDEDVNKLID